MKVNFYISCETDEEMQECLAFMQRMTEKREAKAELPAFTPHKSVPIAAPDDVGDVVGERPNVDPGPSAITKIGFDTKMNLVKELASKQQPASKYTEHLKLLWHRGEIRYDGFKWYL